MANIRPNWPLPSTPMAAPGRMDVGFVFTRVQKKDVFQEWTERAFKHAFRFMSKAWVCKRNSYDAIGENLTISERKPIARSDILWLYCDGRLSELNPHWIKTPHGCCQTFSSIKRYSGKNQTIAVHPSQWPGSGLRLPCRAIGSGSKPQENLTLTAHACGEDPSSDADS